MADDRPLTSIVIPCYNHGHFLGMALDSVLAQSCASWEAIIVDDGSTDETNAVAASFRDPRIHYIYQKNQGLSAARNTGVRAAQGTYLAFLDADDAWESRFLQTCVDILVTQATTMAVVTLTRFIDENGTVLPKIGGEVVSQAGFRSRLLEGGFFPVHAVLVRSEAVLRAGLFDESLTSVEDWDLWLRITASGNRVVCIPEPLAHYRVSANSMSTNILRMHANRMAVLTKHFGSLDGDPAGWSLEKRQAYGYAYRQSALTYFEQGQPEDGWRYLRVAVSIYPPLLSVLSTFYEIALGAQRKGFRGTASLVDFERSRVDLFSGLDELFADQDCRVQTWKNRAYATGNLALAMLNDQAGNWTAARRHLLLAFHSHPRFLRDYLVVRRFLKLLLGRRLISNMQQLRHKAANSSEEAHWA